MLVSVLTGPECHLPSLRLSAVVFCVRLCLIPKTLNAKYNIAINIAVSYSRLKTYGISRLINVYALFSAYLLVEQLKIKYSSTFDSRLAGLKISES